jgi:DNA-directed RNA polymerase subunit H (RpoH/RPB5)
MEVDIIINNLKELLLDRKDDISEFEEHEVDVDRDEFYNDKNVIEFHTSHTTIIFALTKKLRRSILEELKDASDDIMQFTSKYNDKKNVILIFSNDTNSTPIVQQLNKYDKMLQKKGGGLQCFHVKNLLFNPTKHFLVPKHIKLTPEEASEVMDKYLLKKTQMPYILHTDVIAKWLGLKHGDIVKIERLNENSGISYYYRVCI